ncbi:hypothetical protein M378DRAFT_161717 [Amanita muscaria Koide BX008]|uniref:Uncharacterized protein n=1 Tax=Amanita muscaria (strain Koide BX008) TaxID=946122 RepID=A0A0C2WVC6_AMAMK|nr:hypothetical protein M378DRAFT_161717 [Amanita muscaria Koide BX008]
MYILASISDRDDQREKGSVFYKKTAVELSPSFDPQRPNSGGNSHLSSYRETDKLHTSMSGAASKTNCFASPLFNVRTRLA